MKSFYLTTKSNLKHSKNHQCTYRMYYFNFKDINKTISYQGITSFIYKVLWKRIVSWECIQFGNTAHFRNLELLSV
jgi:hypothetical protein